MWLYVVFLEYMPESVFQKVLQIAIAAQSSAFLSW